MQEIIIIAAMAENRVIGRNNVMPWSIKEEMAHFTKLTKGYPCIMGRKTWEHLPKKPLPGRLNVVVSRTMTAEDQALSLKSSSVPKTELCPQGASPAQGFKLCPSLPAAIEFCADYEKIFICGGETIYRQALEFANKIELTVIHKNYEGDTFFPGIDESCWVLTNKEGPSSVPKNQHRKPDLCPQSSPLPPGLPVSNEDFDVFTFFTYTRTSNFGDRA